MKKAFFTLALLVQVGFAMAHNKTTLVTQARHENVKMFQQAGTATPVMGTLSTSDQIQFVRKLNTQWAIVTANGQTGYVLLSELAGLKKVRTEAK